MTINILHIKTYCLPIIILGSAMAIHIFGIITGRDTLNKISRLIYIFSFFITTIICAMGGASMRNAESSGGIDIGTLKIHAWTSMLIFILSVATAYYSYKSVRGKMPGKKSDILILSLSVVYLAVYIVTTLIAFRIR